ncbi:nitrate- and nitrite sensing domain-containing protein, partial [Leisingera sp. F5]|uniref:nitrate- and nitrite sensing domain-containing protein n=1 Tax=Leisingera sp. F5 TaxID=1813816 RepID=UPI000A57F567
MSLRSQILALIAVPFIALAGIGGFKALTDWDRFQSAQVSQEQTRESVALMKVVHFLQVERGLSAVYLSSAGQAGTADLTDTRTEVDAAVQNVPQSAASIVEHLDQLAALRGSVTSQELTPGQMGARYSAMIASILQDTGNQLLHQKNAELAQLSAGLVSLAYAKEAAGQQRAAGAAGFGQGSFNLNIYSWFTGTNAVEKQLLDIAGLAFGQMLPELNIRQGLEPTGLPGIRTEVLE